MLLGQSQISLKNASFEDEPQDATCPAGWIECEPETTPDILPGPWGVHTEPSDGETFMGIITRNNGTFESVGQRLSKPMKANECYTFSLDLAHSRTYAGYNMPLRLKIYAGSSRCGKNQLLGETELITHQEWQSYSFEFVTKGAYEYILFEAAFGNGLFGSYKGNILLDACSAIELCQRVENTPEPVNEGLPRG